MCSYLLENVLEVAHLAVKVTLLLGIYLPPLGRTLEELAIRSGQKDLDGLKGGLGDLSVEKRRVIRYCSVDRSSGRSNKVAALCIQVVGESITEKEFRLGSLRYILARGRGGVAHIDLGLIVDEQF